MECQGCDKRAEFHVTSADEGEPATEHRICSEHARDFLRSAIHPAMSDADKAIRASEDEVRCRVRMVVIAEDAEQQIVFLREEGGDREVPIVTGIFEATSLSRCLRGERAPRPLTHDTMARVIDALGGELRAVAITELRDHTYYAKLRISQAGRPVEVDVRPSDALVLGVLAGVPILVGERILEEVASRESG